MKIYLTLLILFLSEFVNATTIIKNGKLMYHAWTNEEKKPYATTDYREKSLYFNVQSDSLGNNWTIRIDDTDRTWAYVVRFASDIILLYVSENKNSENRLLRLFIEQGDSLLSDFYVEQTYNPLPFKETDFTFGYQQKSIPLHIPTQKEPSFRTPSWIQVVKKERNAYIFDVAENKTGTARADTLFITDANQMETRPLLFFQYPKSNDFMPQSVLARDKKLQIVRGECSSEQPGGEIKLSFDGNLETNYHSAWDNTANNYFPISITYHFSQPEVIDYLIYSSFASTLIM